MDCISIKEKIVKWNKQIKKSLIYEILSFMKIKELNQFIKVKNKRYFRAILYRLKFFDSIEIDFSCFSNNKLEMKDDINVIRDIRDIRDISESNTLSTLAKQITIFNNRINTKNLNLKYLLRSKFFSKVKMVKITNKFMNYIDDLFFNFLTYDNFPSIKTLILPTCKFTEDHNDDSSSVSSIISYESNFIYKKGKYLSQKVIPDLTKVETLKVNLEDFIYMLQDLSTDLNTDNAINNATNNLKEKSVNKNKKTLPNLKKLFIIPHVDWNDIFLNECLESSHFEGNLEALIMPKNSLMNKMGFCNLQGKWTKLKILDLSFNCLGEKGISKILSKNEWSALTELNLSGNQLGPEGMVLISLMKLEYLVKLELNFNYAEKEGAKYLASNSTWRRMERLFLRHNCLRTEGAKEFVKNKSWESLSS